MASARTTRTLKKQEAFCAALRQRGNVQDACEATGIARRTAYQWRSDDTDFAAAWDEALDEAADRMEREAFRRAVEGTNEPVYHQGQEVGAVRKYSDTLLIFLLKAARPEKYRERTETRHTGLTPDEAKNLPDEELAAKLKAKGLL
jgi:hypothetical protein